DVEERHQTNAGSESPRIEGIRCGHDERGVGEISRCADSEAEGIARHVSRSAKGHEDQGDAHARWRWFCDSVHPVRNTAEFVGQSQSLFAEDYSRQDARYPHLTLTPYAQNAR